MSARPISLNNTMNKPRFISRQRGLWMAFLLFWFVSAITQFMLALTGAASLEGLKDATLVSMLWMIPIWWWPQHIKKISAFFAIVIGVLALPGVGYFLIYRQELTQSLMMIIFESNQAESQEYLNNYSSWSIWLGFALFVAIPVFIWRNIVPVSVSRKTAVIWTLLTVLIVFGSPIKKGLTSNWYFAHKSINKHLGGVPPFQLGLGYLNYQTQLAEVESNLLKMNQIPPLVNLKEQSKPLPTTVVLVIGESTTRLHMGLYGYPRDTNPKLSSIKNELHLFKQVYSPRPNTIESLEQVLTFADQEHPNDFKSTPSVMALMKQAGYKTYWITNQQTLTGRNTMLTTFAKQADKQYFLNNERRQNAYSFDEKVLDPFAKVLKQADEKKFIVVHLLGTHMSYKYRYPKSFEYFKDAQGLRDTPNFGQLNTDKIESINAYDNAVRYNDHILFALITALKQTKQHSLLTYFSDHGEDVFDSGDRDFQGRSEAAPTIPMYAVPFIVWHSPDWFKADLFKSPAILERQFDNADFIYTLSEMVGIDYASFEPWESLVNHQHFQEDTILVGDPALKHIKPLPGTKLYMHRNQN